MSSDPLDNLDKAILHLLQVDARNNTNVSIAETVDVAPSTVGDRIEKLEEQGIIDGYHPAINYQKADLPLYTLFVCTAPVAERQDMADQAIEEYGVIDVRETIAGEDNVHIETISRSIPELEEVTQKLDTIGLTINDSELLQRHQTRPFNQFGSDLFDD